jgi:hypothetical protein
MLLAGFTAASIAFVRHEKRFPKPVLPLDLVQSRGMMSHIGLNLFGCIAVVAVSAASALWLVTEVDIPDALLDSCLLSNSPPGDCVHRLSTIALSNPRCAGWIVVDWSLSPPSSTKGSVDPGHRCEYHVPRGTVNAEHDIRVWLAFRVVLRHSSCRGPPRHGPVVHFELDTCASPGGSEWVSRP